MKRNQLLSNLNPLVVHPQWPCMVEYLDSIIEQSLDQLTGCTSWEQAKEIQGRIKALRAIRALQDTVFAEKRDSH